MNRWAMVAIPLALCVVVGEAVVRQWVADNAFRQAKKGIEKYEEELVIHLQGKGPRPSSDLLRGELLKKAVRLEPRSSRYRNYLGRHYQALAADMAISDEEREKLARRALREHEKAVELDPLNGVHRAYLAHVQRAIARHYEARGLNSSISEEERDGFSILAKEYHGKAIANFEKAISLNRSNPFIRNLYEAYRGRL
jgi:tetratricopeptide (TPR) repeat protein